MDTTFERLREALSGQYRIDREIGAGGMATVYLAEDLRHHRRVAVKVLRPELASALGPERFFREIEIVAALTHPHILPLHDSGEADGLLYYVMPFIEGESLRERLRRQGRLDVGEASHLLREIVDALGEAHARGIVHRDVKPANVLLSGRHALVADFGVAKAVSEVTGKHKVTTVGVALGTPRYMAPEQAAAEPGTDHRADLFAAGVIAYEMLTGESPFAAHSAQATFAALLTKEPLPIASVRPDIPVELSDIVMRCLAKDPSARWQTATALLEALESVLTPATGVRPAVRPRAAGAQRALGPSLAVSGVAAAGIAIWLLGSFGDDQVAWARNEALPEIERYVEVGEWEAAHRLAERAEEVIPGDTRLAELRSTFSWRQSIETEPPGANVRRRDYAAGEEGWEELGATPMAEAATPFGASVFSLELEGFRPVELVVTAGGAIAWRMDPEGSIPDDMVRVPGFSFDVDGQALELGSFLIDRHEVTNREYQAFVDAGGYERPELWEHPIVASGRTLAWDEAMALFADRTGRRGPSTWEVGSFPEGEGDFPVGGVSWYEAAAYARFAGKELPTVHHWQQAFGASDQAYFIPVSNLEGTSVRSTTESMSLGRFGTYDMAGNVREWSFNASGDQRFILGGGWNDPYYLATDLMYAQPPLDRSATNGIRLAVHPESDGMDAARSPISREPPPDFLAIPPLADDVFEVYTRQFAYDPTPLEAVVDRADTATYWVRERITFDAAYGDERMVLYLYLPRDGTPPYQTIVYFPGSAALAQQSIDQWRTIHLDFALRSGRAVAFPVFKGTFERDSDLRITDDRPTSQYRDHVIQWAKDLSRSIDYLETRSDLNTDDLGYYGFSWGGRLASIILAVEPRFDAAVLYVAGYNTERAYPEVDVVHYTPRVTIPVLMLNGRYDDVFPLGTHAMPMFERLGTPPEHKRHVVSDGGHFVPRTQLIAETLDWFDRYLGPAR